MGSLLASWVKQIQERTLLRSPILGLRRIVCKEKFYSAFFDLNISYIDYMILMVASSRVSPWTLQKILSTYFSRPFALLQAFKYGEKIDDSFYEVFDEVWKNIILDARRRTFSSRWILFDRIDKLLFY